ncbi:sugar ABC transporter ATP-binding protein [Cohnella laeviribosi]|uniref:sugar ABC transporter ATP-binding protein n=1 Tax=Cohnella laeviribosi TaxID=380174 RepID=UPI0003795E0E|nr:sugar ABC transporter ATP-binding protein [Cohnella laeviribosi]
MSEKVLSLKNIKKEYPGVVALKDVSLDIYAGEVHALLGENGAGKSTLIKIIAGAIQPSAGSIVFSDGVVHQSMTPQKAKEYGVEVIYQEFNLVGCLSVAENICFGEKHGKFVNRRYMKKVAREAFDLFGVDIDPSAAVYELPASKQQIVEISKAIFRNVKILIMDEPSAALSVAEVEKMFQVIRKLKERGVAIIYITHRMDELFEISDKVTVMRDGEYITTVQTKETNRQELVNYMVGRELKETFPVRPQPSDEVVLKVKDLSGNGFRDISFELRKGEILGVAGLVGAGRTEMARAIYGADKKHAGRVYVNGRLANTSSPAKSIRNGIGMIPEDRKQHGCLLTRSILTNISLSSLKQISKLGFINKKKERELAQAYKDELMIKAPNLEQLVGNLSGGNQQKVVIAKTLAANCNVIIFDEPTRGIDVGAKQEIYKLMAKIVSEGNAILMITSEMEELIGMSDRILVLHEGKSQGILEKHEFSQSRILEMASGISIEKQGA